jgi:hypothetical protein
MMEGEKFIAFRTRLRTLFEVPADDPWAEGPCVEVLFDVVSGTDSYFEFSYAHLRTTQDLLLGAVLLSEWQAKRVVFLTATAYYALQASKFVRRYRDAGIAACPTLSVGVAGALPIDTLRRADVILHHGRVYPLPEDVKPQRTVVQVFEGEIVPHDTRPLSSLMCMGGDE